MTNHPNIAHILLQSALLLACTVPANAHAETESRDRQEIHHLQLQLRAAQQDKSDLSTQVDTLKKQLADLEAKRSALEKKLSGQSKQLSDLSDKQLSDKQQLADLADKYKLLEQQYAENNKNLQQTQAEKEQQKKQLEGEIRVCEKMNADLYQLGVKLMDRYRDKGVWDALLQAEPFTQLENVKMENLLQDYRDRAASSRFTSAGSVGQDAR